MRVFPQGEGPQRQPRLLLPQGRLDSLRSNKGRPARPRMPPALSVIPFRDAVVIPGPVLLPFHFASMLLLGSELFHRVLPFLI